MARRSGRRRSLPTSDTVAFGRKAAKTGDTEVTEESQSFTEEDRGRGSVVSAARRG
jgi:hypothetical protein